MSVLPLIVGKTNDQKIFRPILDDRSGKPLLNVQIAVENISFALCVILAGNPIAQAGWGNINLVRAGWGDLFKREEGSRDAKFPFVIGVSPLVGGNHQVTHDIPLIDPVHSPAASLQHLHLTAFEIDCGDQSISSRRSEIDPDIVVGVLPLIIDKSDSQKMFRTIGDNRSGKPFLNAQIAVENISFSLCVILAGNPITQAGWGNVNSCAWHSICQADGQRSRVVRGHAHCSIVNLNCYIQRRIRFKLESNTRFEIQLTANDFKQVSISTGQRELIARV